MLLACERLKIFWLVNEAVAALMVDDQAAWDWAVYPFPYHGGVLAPHVWLGGLDPCAFQTGVRFAPHADGDDFKAVCASWLGLNSVTIDTLSPGLTIVKNVAKRNPRNMASHLQLIAEGVK